MKQYLDLMQHILDNGHEKKDRTGTGTLSIFGYQMRFNLQDGFPLVTTKKCHLRSIIHELLWFLNGDTNTKYLNDNDVTIWDEWAAQEDVKETFEYTPHERVCEAVAGNYYSGSINDLIKHLQTLGDLTSGHVYLDKLGVPRGSEVVHQHKGELGPIYGKQWRDWVGPDGKHHDQIATVIKQLRNDPDSRRIIVSAWNVGELDQMALAPCHSFFQFYSREMTFEERERYVIQSKDSALENYLDERVVDDTVNAIWMDEHNVPKRLLSCHLYMRSMDVFLGTPFNIASYALLTHMVAQQADMVVGEFVLSGGDVHLYSNHMEQVDLQLTREPRELPTLVIKRKPDSIFDYKFDDFQVVGYDPHPAIKAPVAK